MKNKNIDIISALSNRDSSFSNVIPKSKVDRDRFLILARDYIATEHLTPPLSEEELSFHAKKLIESNKIQTKYSDFITVLINNELWRDTIASIPFERRILLIPQCLRSSTKCKAQLDEFGLLCEQCNGCSIGKFQQEAEELGYVVLIAEGTTVVTKLIESGKIDAVIGISCLSVLERSFQHMAANAVPGVAIPLIHDGCNNTIVDDDWVLNNINLKSKTSNFHVVDIPAMHKEIKGWFGKDNIEHLFGEPCSISEKLAIDWLGKSGKRWRPFLLTATYSALKSENAELDESIQKLALAVECFHKASLIHDDIEDKDDFRYEEATLHNQEGVSIALNTGDLLLGEGYRMIAECDKASSAQIAQMLKIAAVGHKTLCLGQGEELWLEKRKEMPSSVKLIDLFKWKTSPAFEVALLLGAVFAGADESVCAILHKFSESLGIAYQINDDLEDFNEAYEMCKPIPIHSSLLISLAMEMCDNKDRCKLLMAENNHRELFNYITEMNINVKAQQLCEYYKNEAVRSLTSLENSQLKSLLRKIIMKIC